MDYYNNNYDDIMPVDPRLNTLMVTPVSRLTSNINSVNANIQAHLPPYLNINRAGSTASLASSIGDQPQRYLADTSLLQHEFVELLVEVYQLVCSDPTITPFDQMNPPSGILNKVAKLAIDQARTRHVEIGLNSSVGAVPCVRQRLSQEIRNEGYLSRNASMNSLPPPSPQFSELFNGSNNNLSEPLDPSFFNSHSETLPQRRYNSKSRISNTVNSGVLQPQPTLLHEQNQNNSLYVLTPNTSEINLGSSSYLNLNHSLFPRHNNTIRTASPLAVNNSDLTNNLTAANLSDLEQNYQDPNQSTRRKDILSFRRY